MKVLIAEDDPLSMIILRRAVESLGHTCVPMRDGIAAWDAFLREQPDVIISDWLMPGMEGIEFCRRVRAAEAGTYTYFVFMTALSGKQHFLEGMRAGADDYLTKPVDMDDLEARLLVASRVMSLHRRLLAQNAELERLSRLSHEAARTDPLTRTGNRLRLREDLEALRARVARYGHRYAAALCDVDDFKKYNDAHGHLAGDEALATVARTLSGGVRAGDAVYRYGGEEFLVILAEQSHTGAATAMERIRAAVEALAIPHTGKAPPGVLTLSIGIASLEQTSTPSWEDWLTRADEALYRAKAAGKNRIEIVT